MTRFPAAAALGVSLRRMTDADLPFVEALYASTRAEELAVTGWPMEVRAAFLAQQHRAQHAHYTNVFAGLEPLIVERGGAPIGRLYLLEHADDLRIVDIALMPAARGHGIGTALLADVFDRARAGGGKVSIHVERNNPARTLYARVGFRQVTDDGGVYDRWEWSSASIG